LDRLEVSMCHNLLPDFVLMIYDFTIHTTQVRRKKYHQEASEFPKGKRIDLPFLYKQLQKQALNLLSTEFTT
jgi:hypothetical protein